MSEMTSSISYNGNSASRVYTISYCGDSVGQIFINSRSSASQTSTTFFEGFLGQTPIHFFHVPYLDAPQWGAADAEIKVLSGENTELERSPFKAWSRSVYRSIQIG